MYSIAVRARLGKVSINLGRNPVELCIPLLPLDQRVGNLGVFC